MPYPDDENQIASSIRHRMEALRGEGGYRVAFRNCLPYEAIEENAIEDDDEGESLEGACERRRQSCDACHGKGSPPSEEKTIKRVNGTHAHRRDSQDGDDPAHPEE